MENEEIKPVKKEEKQNESQGTKPEWGSFMVSMNGVFTTISISGKEFTDEQKAKIASECSNAGIALLQKINKILI